jgi:hypothetical protein
MSTESAKVIAEIAVTLTDKPVPTAVEVLLALNRAYEEGVKYGLSLCDPKVRELAKDAGFLSKRQAG